MSLLNKIVLAALNPLLKSFDFACAHPGQAQEKVFRTLMEAGRATSFGKEHGFADIKDYHDFRRRIPIREYDEFVPYIERLRRGEDYVLWNQKTCWFAKSSGTSSDKSKYIPVTPDALQDCHYRGFKTMLGTYVRNYPASGIFEGKALTLGGSVKVDDLSNGSAVCGDLSAILLKNSPRLVEFVRTPAREVAMLPDFEEKIAQICRICSGQRVTNFSGVPSWNLVMLEKILEYNHAKYVTDVWPHLELFMHGGISFEPYRAVYHKLIPSDKMHYLENYNASEGYFALQDNLSQKGMTLATDNGVFYEFIPMTALDKVLRAESDEVYTVDDVQCGINYAMVISTNAGLWRYLIGDCVEFISKDPHRILITGRTKLFINAFGEELMIHNAETALARACKECGVEVADYTVAPIFMDGTHGRGAHEWVVEFSLIPEQTADQAPVADRFRDALDAALCQANSDYEAKRRGDVTMTRPVITVVPPGTFYRWMERRGKTGGQNKVPRLCGDRRYVEAVLAEAKQNNV